MDETHDETDGSEMIRISMFMGFHGHVHMAISGWSKVLLQLLPLPWLMEASSANTLHEAPK
jgi:hypothetical protein